MRACRDVTGQWHWDFDSKTQKIDYSVTAAAGRVRNAIAGALEKAGITEVTITGGKRRKSAALETEEPKVASA